MKNRNIFQQCWFVRSNNNYKTISTGGDKSNALSQVEFRAVASAQRDNIIRETIEVEKKRWIEVEFWRIPELIAPLAVEHLDNSYSSQLRKDFIRKNILS